MDENDFGSRVGSEIVGPVLRGKQLQTIFTALRWRTDHDRSGIALLHLSGEAQPILRPGRIGRPPWMNQNIKPLLFPRASSVFPGAFAIHHHHPQ